MEAIKWFDQAASNADAEQRRAAVKLRVSVAAKMNAVPGPMVHAAAGATPSPPGRTADAARSSSRSSVIP
jgi:hypothetical protein